MKVCVRLVLHVVERIRIVSPSDGTEKGAGTVKSANLVTDCRSHQIVLVNVAVAVLLEGFHALGKRGNGRWSRSWEWGADL